MSSDLKEEVTFSIVIVDTMKMERIQTLETMKYNTNKTVIRDHILISKNCIPMKITASTVQQQSYSLSNQTCKIYMQQVHVLITLYYICLIAIYFKHLIGKLFSLPKGSIIRTLHVLKKPNIQ